MKYSSIYLVVKDFDKSLDFYEKLLEMKVSATNGKRFAMFNNDGLNLCLMNGYYDELYPEKKETKGEIYPEYDDMVDIANAANSRKVFIKLQENIRNKNYQYVKYDNFRCMTAVRCASGGFIQAIISILT